MKNMTDYERIEKAIKFLENNFRDQPSLDDVAKELNLSSYHFQKLFKTWAGISPKKFLQFLTLEHVKSRLKDSETILESTFDAGLSSTSRTHELFLNIEAVTPAEYKKSGANLHITYGIFDTPFGSCLIASTEKGICQITFLSPGVNEKVLVQNLRHEWPKAIIKKDLKQNKPYFEHIFGNVKSSKPINLLLKGTNFQIQVWKALLNIQSGQVTTYESIANSINNPKAIRAVGSAIAKNNIAYLIPCHRVINKIGVIGKYRWGTERKKAMLLWEENNRFKT